MKKIKFYKNEMIEVEIYKLVDFYDPILRQPTVPVKLETHDDFEYARKLAFNLASTLGEYQGLGLSANQVGLKDRVCVINMGDEVWSLFNPEITERSAVPSKYQEGCLSYPGLLLTLNRSEWIKVKFQAVGGQWVEEKFSGLTAVCIQHEIDHLDGIMYTDKVSPIKLEQAKRKVKKTLKKMKEASIQYARQQELLEQQKKQEQSIEKPKIQILGLDTAPVQVKTPEKFVYNPIPS
jgi:peptide deformylase